MNTRFAPVLFVATLLLCSSLFATEPNTSTRRWWSHIEAIASDAMQGRDTGSEGYRKAAGYVVQQFVRNGLKAAGESGYYQPVPLRRVRLRTDQSDIELVQKDGVQKLQWFQQVTVPANAMLPEAIDAGLVFVGSSSYAQDLDIKGKILVQLSPPRLMEGAPMPVVTAPPAGTVGLLGIDSTGGPEPRQWPVQYSVAMTLAGQAPAQNANPGLSMAFNPAFADLLFEGSGHSYRELLSLSSQGKPLPNFALPNTLRARMRVESEDLTSDNLIAVLPGTDPILANEHVVVSAHLDGYGVGEPRNGDSIYNGAFDDAAYVATLIGLAERLHDSHKKLKRSVLFVVVTGEEKGLLGSRYFTQHPSIPSGRMVADINLDALRPIFPLKMLTVVGLDESTLGDTVKRVAEPMSIRIQRDLEPLRNLMRRGDLLNFMQVGVPAVGFVFGYDKGSAEERVYRRWYAERYHAPGDDLKQPWDPPAAAKFNEFFYRLVETLADDNARPRWNAGNAFGQPTQ